MGPLLEREAELSGLAADLRAAASGEGRLLVIEGPPGIGKTRLLDAASRRAGETGLFVLHARGGELEREFAFGIVRQLFEPPLARASPAERKRLFAGAAGLSAQLFGDAQAGSAAVGDPAYAVLHGLYWLTANLASATPLLLVVDDIHFADAASLRWLAYLARRLEGLALLLAIASRVGEPGTPLSLLSELTGAPDSRLLRPAPLSRAAVDELVIAELGPAATEPLCRACHRATGGNPFLLGELLRELARSGPNSKASVEEIASLAPEAVARAVLVRLGRQTDTAMALAKSAAALGERVELRHAAALAGLELGEAREAADALARAEILIDGRPLEFVHPIVRSAVAADLPAGFRTEVNGKAARLLAAEGLGPQEYAPYLLAAEPIGDPWVVRSLQDATSWALSHGAQEEAAVYLNRALREPPASEQRATLLAKLGATEILLGRTSSIGHLREAIEASQSPEQRASAALELAQAFMLTNRLRDSVETLEHAIAEVAPSDPAWGRRLECALISLGMFDSSRRAQLTERLDRLRAEPSGDALERALLDSMAAREACFAGVPADEAAALALRALADGRLLAFASGERIEYYFAAVTLLFADRYDEAERALTAALDEARRRGSAVGFAVSSCFLALLRRRQGRLAQAEADANASIDILDGGSWRGMAFATLIEVLIERGELAAARETLVRGEREGWQVGNLQLNLPRHSRGVLSLAEGALEQGVNELLDAGRRQRKWGVDNPAIVPWRSSVAPALVALGLRRQALELASEEVTLARKADAPRALGIALRASGLVEGGKPGLDRLRDAAIVLDRSGAELERARAMVELGAALHRAGSRAEARESLRSGLEIAHRCGAATLAARAVRELRATGVRARRPARTGVASLTPSELRVAELVARGLSNKEAAQALFVTEKTIETHLGNTYGKLGVHSRVELTQVLAPRGISSAAIPVASQQTNGESTLAAPGTGAAPEC